MVIGVFANDEPSLDLEARGAGEMPGLAHHWRVGTHPQRSADELALLLAQLLSMVAIAAPGLSVEGASGSIHGVALCSSVPSMTSEVRLMMARWLDVPLVVVEPGIKTGMAIRIDNPKEVGADRVVNAVGAMDLYVPPAIVVDLGTATTFDAISRAGEYLGGAIVPGIGISMDALVDKAAALRRVELAEPRSAIGRNTVEAMQSGAIFGYAGLVDGLCERIERELGDATVIATGGFSGLIGPYVRAIDHIEPWLTLHGLRLIFDRNQPGTAAT